MKWVQYNPEYCDAAEEQWQRTKKWDFDSSHEISEIDAEGTRRRVATFRHADDAALVESLVNALRDGKLMICE